MKKTFAIIRRSFITALALVLMLGAVAIPGQASGFEDEAWVNNVLTAEPIDTFGIDREKIGTVTFLDSTEDAPRYCWHMGVGSSSSVKGWVEWSGGFADIYFAADGGINGERCTVGMFKDCTNLTAIEFNGAFHTDHCTSMKEMFRGCTSLRSLDVTDLNTSNVKNMYAMFSTCPKLTELDVSGFDTAKVTNMGFMFSACRRVKELDVSKFDTGKVTNMEGMFRWCNELDGVDVSGWNISRVRTYSNFMNDGMHINGRPWIEFFE